MSSDATNILLFTEITLQGELSKSIALRLECYGDAKSDC